MLTNAIIERAMGKILHVVQSMVFAVARFSYVAKSSADGVTDTVEGPPINPDEGTQIQDNVRRLGGGWGLWSVPPKGEPALVVRAGGGATNGVLVACGSARYAPANMADGDVALYCKSSGVQIYLKASDKSVSVTDGSGTLKLDGTGAATVTAAAGKNINLTVSGGGNVVLNGGTLSVARLTDTVTGTAGPYPLVNAVIASPGATNVKA